MCSNFIINLCFMYKNQSIISRILDKIDNYFNPQKLNQFYKIFYRYLFMMKYSIRLYIIMKLLHMLMYVLFENKKRKEISFTLQLLLVAKVFLTLCKNVTLCREIFKTIRPLFSRIYQISSFKSTILRRR